MEIDNNFSELDRFINKIKHRVKQQGSNELKENTKEMNFDKVFSKEYLISLKNESDKLLKLTKSLNEDVAFKHAIFDLSSKNPKFSLIDLKAEHLFIQDVVNIYNLLLKDFPANNNLKGRFTLAYYYQKLCGKDLATSVSLERLHEMVYSEGFEINLDKIISAKFFETKDSDKLIIPKILFKLNHNSHSQASIQLFRFANHIVKSDDEVSEEEMETLKTLLKELNEPEVNSSKQANISEAPENETLEDVLAELNSLIGLDEIKGKVKELVNFLKVQKLRESKSLPTASNSLHSVFMGPPGTGKTTVARLIARVYKHLGILSKGHLVETDRSGLVAGYIGQTAIKVDELVKQALGGVLFIDEAYSISSSSDNQRDFGKEALEVLLKRMEDHRKEFIVIVAGYPVEMKQFIESNPGLKSRFNQYFTFNHYEAKTLVGIFNIFCKKNAYNLSEEAEAKLLNIFKAADKLKSDNYGNGRTARNLFERIIRTQANRIVEIKDVKTETICLIEAADIPDIKKTAQEITTIVV